MLVGASIDPYLTDEHNRVAANLIDDQDIKKKIIQNYESDKASCILKVKPDTVKGTVFKTGNFFRNLKPRYLELNTNERSLIRYECKQDSPHKPIEIIPLRDVLSVKEVTDKMFLAPGFHYFEISFGSKIYLATKTKNLSQSWIHYINEAVEYSLRYENLLLKATSDDKCFE